MRTRVLRKFLSALRAGMSWKIGLLFTALIRTPMLLPQRGLRNLAG